MADTKLSVTIEGNSKALQAAVAAAAASTEAASGKMSASLSALGKSFAAVGIAAAAAGSLIVGGFIKKSVSSFIEFEESMVRASATMGNLTEGEFADFNELVRDIAKASAFTAREVADAANVLALAGFGMDTLGSSTEGLLKSLVDFSVAAGTDVDTAAGIAVSSLKAFGLEVEEIDRVMDVMVNTFTSSFTTLEMLGQSMKFLAPTARAAGIEIEEAAAAVGALGNSGLQASIAGTGLRMAINKLLAPTDEARQAMTRLGLNFVTLTPAGNAAKASLDSLGKSLETTRMDLENTTSALRVLNDELADLSIDQQRNSLAIMKIRQRADREGRELTKDELDRINRLEQANAGLSIKQQELQIESAIARKEQSKHNHVLSQQEAEYATLNKTVASQTTGLTSLTDVVTQLSDAGATTAEILEIFSVRGGTAIMALLEQKQAFLDLTEANMNAQGTLVRFIDTLSGSTAFALKIVKSNFEETSLVIGEMFAGLITMDKGIAEALHSITESVRNNREGWLSLRDAIATDLVPLLFKLPDIIDSIITAFKIAMPFIRAFGHAMMALGLVLKPVFMILEGIAWLIDKLMGNRITAELTTMAAGAGGGAAAGAAIGAAGGPIGAGVGAAIGLGLTSGGLLIGNLQEAGMFHEGGIATKPTLGVFGEAGAEALVPIDKLPALMAQANSRPQMSGSAPNNGITINFDSITINGGSNMSSGDVRQIIRTEMPRIVKDSYQRGARGAI